MRTRSYTRVRVAIAGAALSALALASAQGQTLDISAGRKRAEVCMACHGENGTAVVPSVPNLAGQNQQYLEKALIAYRGGQMRQDPTMTEMAKPLSDADIANLAAFWHRLPVKKAD